MGVCLWGESSGPCRTLQVVSTCLRINKTQTLAKTIYIHAPKTAGNAIQSLLFDISDDDKIVHHHQDGVDRFEVSGPITFSKHSALRIYNNGLANNLSGWRVMVSIRHPFERAISAYFSPHRWYKQDAQETWTLQNPVWDETQFFDYITPKPLGQFQLITSYLCVNDIIHKPDVVLRHTHLQSDLDAAVKKLGLPVLSALPQLNQSIGSQTLRNKLLSSMDLRSRVETIAQRDMDFFDFETGKIPSQ